MRANVRVDDEKDITQSGATGATSLFTNGVNGAKANETSSLRLRDKHVRLCRLRLNLCRLLLGSRGRLLDSSARQLLGSSIRLVTRLDRTT